jgi:hypothetical protein
VIVNSTAAGAGRYRALTALFTAQAVIMTRPLGDVAAGYVPATDDAYFSIWRLAWVAHQIVVDPQHLFDANIFHPATNTLAYSDAMLLVGALGAPLFHAGVDPGLVHNILLLTAIVSSMLCTFALARRLTGSDPAALIAAMIFGFAPYRMAHLGHLELQWTMWMPLSMLVLHRLIERPALVRGAALGAVLGAQVLCSVYYGVFLACYLLAAWFALVSFAKNKARIAAATVAAIAPLLVVAMIYGPPYLQTRAEFGERRAEEVSTFSAVPSDYLRVPMENRLRGSREHNGVAPDERSLFPGTVAIVLAVLALLPPLSRLSVTYLGLALVAADLSFGSHGVSFQLLQLFSVAGSLRSPARFGVLVLLSIAVLAAIGAARAFRRYPSIVPAATVLIALLCLGEYWSAPQPVRAFDRRPSEIESWLATHPPGTVILQLPAPTGETLWFHEPDYQVRSINHWQRLVNGYSAFPPAHYVRLINELDRFPERDVIEMLRAINVRFILIHRAFYREDEFERIVQAARASSRLWPVRTFGAGASRIEVFELNYVAE